MSKHTKGPWRVEILAGGNFSIWSETMQLALLGSSYFDEVNANVMAAAPDMIAALEAVEYIGGLCPYCERPSIVPHSPRCLIGNAKRKARGEA